MLKFYLKLQVRRIHRMIVDLDLGVHPIVGYILIAAAFLGMSALLFFKLHYFLYLYLFVALRVISIWSDPRHNDFLKLTYSRANYLRIRMTENILSALPFVLFLACSGNWLIALSLLCISGLLTFFSYRVTMQFVVPTPFFKYPFEFIVGTRLSFPIVFLCYFLTYISIKFHNFGIGIFAILAVSVLSIMFYMKLEDPFYVWIFSSNAKRFLLDKIRIAAISLCVLCLPIITALAIANPSRILVILSVQLLGICFVTAGVLCKYSSIPNIIAMREGLLLMFSVFFPPVLFFSIPFFYIQSVKHLKGFLE